MKKLLLGLLLVTSLAATLFTLSACSTVAGAGKDIQKAGQVIEREAHRR